MGSLCNELLVLSEAKVVVHYHSTEVLTFTFKAELLLDVILFSGLFHNDHIIFFKYIQCSYSF